MIADDEKFYMFEPLSSITAYDLAQIMKTMEMGIGESLFKDLPKDLQRHFKELKREA